jgi:hypothetical protein
MALMLTASTAFVSASSATTATCLTKHEARAKFPRAHLYWHGTRHCWDNQRGRKRYRDPVFSKDKIKTASAAEAPPPPVVYRAMTFSPVFDAYLKFLPWERRIAGSF